MAKLIWDKSGEHYYETGVDHGVLYVRNGGAYNKGVAWNGLIAVTESPSGAEPNPLYADNIKYLNLISTEEFSATVEAYTYPKEFEVCDGTAELAEGILIGQQSRSTFGLCYRTKIGNDVDGDNLGYKLHLIYGCLATPSEKNYQSTNETPEAASFSWEVSTTPVNVTGKQPTSTLVIDSRTADPAKLAALETMLYGDESTEPKLPLPDEIATMFAAG